MFHEIFSHYIEKQFVIGHSKHIVFLSGKIRMHFVLSRLTSSI